MENRTRIVVMVGLIAAVYVVLTLALAPISYGPIQFRVSELLKPLALFHPAFSLAFGIGTGMSNLFSPFGPYDYIVMPIIDILAALVCYALRRNAIIALALQSLIISAGVAFFPLGLGGGIPFFPTFFFVLFSQTILIYVGYFVIWKKYGTHILWSR